MSVPVYDITPPNPRRENRRNAREHISAGTALAGAGTAASFGANRSLRRKLGYAPGLKAELKARVRPKHLAVKLGARSAQVTGLGLVAMGAKHLMRPDEKIDPVSLREDVVRPMARTATFQDASKALDPRKMRGLGAAGIGMGGKLVRPPRSAPRTGSTTGREALKREMGLYGRPVTPWAKQQAADEIDAGRRAGRGRLEKALLPKPKPMRTRGQLVPRPRSTRAVGVGTASSMPGVSKADWSAKDQDRLRRRRRAGRGLSLAGGTMGLAALGLRAPSAAKVLVRRGARGPGLAALAARDSAATGHSNTLGVLAVGTGSAGSFNYASQQKLERRKEEALSKAKDRTTAGSAVVGAGAVTAATGLVGGGIPGFQSNSSTIRDVRQGGWARRTGAAMSSGRGGIFGYRTDAHQGALNRFEADKVKYAGRKTKRENMFLRGRGDGKIAPEKDIIRHLKVGRKISHGMLAGGGALVVAGSLAAHQRQVRKDDRSVNAYHGAIAGGGASLAALGLGGGAVLNAQGRQWKARSDASLREAERVVPSVRAHRSSADIAADRKLWSRRTPTPAQAYEAGLHRGDATQARYFSRVYRASGKMATKVGIAGVAAGAAGAGGLALQRRKTRVRKAGSHLAPSLSSRVSPQAEASYNRMHRDRTEMRAQAAGQGALAGILGVSAGEQLRQSHFKAKWGTAATLAGAATTAFGAYRSARQAHGRTRAMSGIEAAGRRRARAKQYGAGRGLSPVDPTSRARNLASAATRST